MANGSHPPKPTSGATKPAGNVATTGAPSGKKASR